MPFFPFFILFFYVLFCFVLTSPPPMLCVYLQTFEAALFLEKEERPLKMTNFKQKSGMYDNFT